MQRIHGSKSDDKPEDADGASLRLLNIDHTITLPDGRDLSYAQYGVENGPSVLHVHGLPGSRLEGALYHDAAVKLSLRALTIDGPGVGLSSPHIGRSAAIFACDVQCLVDDLEIKRWAIMGVSGGGPYALACAQSQPAGLRAVAMVATKGPHDIGRDGMSTGNRVLFYCFEHYPWLARLIGRFSMRQRALLTEDNPVEAMVKLHKSRLPQALKPPPKELEVLLDEKTMRMFWRSSCEFSKQGPDAFCEEGRIMTSDQDLRLQDIGDELPIRLWYGKEDQNVGPRMGTKIKARLGGRATLWMEDAGHVWLVVIKAEDVLRDLKQFL